MSSVSCHFVCLFEESDGKDSKNEGEEGDMEWFSGGLTNTLMILSLNTTTYTDAQNLNKHSASPTLHQSNSYLINLSLVSLSLCLTQYHDGSLLCTLSTSCGSMRS